MGSLALSNGSNVYVALGAPGTLALFDVTDNLTLDGILNVEDLGGFGVGLYRIFDYGGVLTDNGMDIGATPAGVPASALSIQTAIDNEVNLLSTAGVTLNFWDGPSGPNNGVIDGGDGVWNTANHNWTDANGAVNAPWGNGQFAIFQGNAGTVTVETDAGISVIGMQFAVDGYTVTGKRDRAAKSGDCHPCRNGSAQRRNHDRHHRTLRCTARAPWSSTTTGHRRVGVGPFALPRERRGRFASRRTGPAIRPRARRRRWRHGRIPSRCRGCWTGPCDRR